MKTRTCYLKQMAPRSYYYRKYAKSGADWNPNPYFSQQYTSQTGRLERHSITWDDTKRSGRVFRTRSCDHTVVVSETRSYSMEFYLDGTKTTKGVYSPSGEDFYGEYSVPVPNLASCHLEALEFFKSGCTKAEMSLVNSVWELREVQQLAGPIFDTLKKFKKSSPFNLHLWWSFGIKPFMQDLETIRLLIPKIKSKIAWLRKNQGKPVKVKFSKDLSTSSLPADRTVDWTHGCTKYETTSHKVTYTAYALIVYDVAGLSDLELELKTILHAVGGDKPLSILWEGTPYSFVLDWFIKVGDFIARCEPAIEFPYKFLDVGHYIKIESTRLIKNVWYSPLPGYAAEQLSQTDHFRFFYRRAGLPISLPTLDLGDPGINQLALGISLFATKML